MHYVSLKIKIKNKNKKTLQNLKHFQITNIDNLIQKI